MSMLSALLRPVFAALKVLLIGAIALGALAFGTMVAFAIFIGVSLARLLRGRDDPAPGPASERVFDAEYEVVRRPGSGVLTPTRRDHN
ncbi:MAG: hypothetical protein IPF83_14760 [Rhodanobacteraceae bacterium]|nr:hypothetical protein [Rhodanobacteraceae bacterium]MBK7043987.1 hypothetical protein [Rhodanobacteraceae bacterium]MBP9155761.1 hypothetical protein [Xanthomonadales bacterium]HQW81718.1 hypothetical protein [Pseudomonadota bacterium]